MRMYIVIAALSLAVSTANAQQPSIVSLQFYKDSCEKFLQSEPSDQDMYVMWASGHIKREFAVDLASASLSKPLRDYCAANPTTTFVDATAAVKSEMAPGAKQ